MEGEGGEEGGGGRLCCGFSEGVISQELSDATRLLKTRNLL